MPLPAEECDFRPDLHSLATPTVQFRLVNPVLALRGLADFARDTGVNKWRGRGHDRKYIVRARTIKMICV
jgi:hypothetical protein